MTADTTVAEQAARLAARAGAVRSAEAPPELLTEADLVVGDRPGCGDLLERLVAWPSASS